MGESYSTHKIDGKSVHNFSPFGRSRHRWEGNFKMFLQEIWSEHVDWIYVVQVWV
jgi:hypothetical protein